LNNFVETKGYEKLVEECLQLETKINEMRIKLSTQNDNAFEKMQDFFKNHQMLIEAQEKLKFNSMKSENLKKESNEKNNELLDHSKIIQSLNNEIEKKKQEIIKMKENKTAMFVKTKQNEVQSFQNNKQATIQKMKNDLVYIKNMRKKKINEIKEKLLFIKEYIAGLKKKWCNNMECSKRNWFSKYQ